MTIDLTPAADELAVLVAGVADDQLSAPTPCEAMDVATLLDHIGGLSLAFTAAAAKAIPPGATSPPEADGATIGDGFRTDIAERLRALASAWRDPEAWTGMTVAGGLELPGEVGGLVALDELVLHGWDLAVATGQAFEVDPDAAEAVLGFVSSFAGPGHDDERTGLFGPEVTVADDAPLLDRILGMAGRDPAWSPPA